MAVRSVPLTGSQIHFGKVTELINKLISDRRLRFGLKVGELRESGSRQGQRERSSEKGGQQL